MSGLLHGCNHRATYNRVWDLHTMGFIPWPNRHSVLITYIFHQIILSIAFIYLLGYSLISILSYKLKPSCSNLNSNYIYSKCESTFCVCWLRSQHILSYSFLWSRNLVLVQHLRHSWTRFCEWSTIGITIPFQEQAVVTMLFSRSSRCPPASVYIYKSKPL